MATLGASARRFSAKVYWPCSGKYRRRKIDQMPQSNNGLADVEPFLPMKEGPRFSIFSRRDRNLSSLPRTKSSQPFRRGRARHRMYFQYQNWDFNAAGTAFEKLTGKRTFCRAGRLSQASRHKTSTARQRKNNGCRSQSTRNTPCTYRRGTWHGLGCSCLRTAVGVINR
jgi:hypothetical protein